MVLASKRHGGLYAGSAPLPYYKEHYEEKASQGFVAFPLRGFFSGAGWRGAACARQPARSKEPWACAVLSARVGERLILMCGICQKKIKKLSNVGLTTGEQHGIVLVYQIDVKFS